MWRPSVPVRGGRGLLVLSCGIALTLTACAAQHAYLAPGSDPPLAVSQFPSVADYNTLRSARAVLNQALFLEHDWRRQAFAARIGLTVLMTMHRPAPGRCLEFIAHTYDELLSLHDNYRGENWAPLMAMVRHDRPLTVCRAPKPPRISASA